MTVSGETRKVKRAFALSHHQYETSARRESQKQNSELNILHLEGALSIKCSLISTFLRRLNYVALNDVHHLLEHPSQTLNNTNICVYKMTYNSSPDSQCLKGFLLFIHSLIYLIIFRKLQLYFLNKIETKIIKKFYFKIFIL